MFNKFTKLSFFGKTIVLIISFCVLSIGYYYFFTKPEPPKSKEEQQKEQQKKTVIGSYIFDPLKKAAHTLQSNSGVNNDQIQHVQQNKLTNNIKEEVKKIFNKKTLMAIPRYNFLFTLLFFSICSLIILKILPDLSYYGIFLVRTVFKILKKIVPALGYILDTMKKLGASNPSYRGFTTKALMYNQ